MKSSEYFKEKFVFIVVNFLILLLSSIMLLAFSVNKILITIIVCINVIFIFIYLICDFIKKKKFYDKVNSLLDKLDKKYLIHEIIEDGTFLEAKLLTEYLYEIDKSYNDEINSYKYSLEEFKEYLELWCHEIKTPIATSKLIINNNKSKVTESVEEEINKIENYVEQVLYYARCENVENDYIITKVNVNELINEVIKNNKKVLISKKIKINIFKEKVIVESDSKWLRYIINQILLNSIKYSRDKGIIDFSYIINKNNIIISIKDNGIGISESDINRVFDKGFTGSNGRINIKSTGMGLYLCKKLCERLGHDIKISSIENEGTELLIIFPNSKL